MHNGPQLDLSTQVAMVRAKVRPWRSMIAPLLAIAAGVTSGWAHAGFTHFMASDHVPKQLIAAGCAVAFCVCASIATYGLSGNARDVLAPRAGAAHAAIVRYALLLVGAFTTLIVTLDLFRVPVGQLVLGGALTSVFVGIARAAGTGQRVRRDRLARRPALPGRAHGPLPGWRARRRARGHRDGDRHHLRSAVFRGDSGVGTQLTGTERGGRPSASCSRAYGPGPGRS